MHLLKHFKELSLRPKNAQELKGLILQLAVQGKLTNTWRKENPSVPSSVDLIKRIKEYNENQLRLNNRSVKRLKVENEITLDLPNGWVQVRNFELFNLQKGKNPKDLTETIKKYAYQDIQALDRGNVRRYSDDEKAPKCTNEDILVVCDGSRSGLVLEGKDGIVGSTLAIIQTPPFIKQYIKIIFLQDYQRANENMIGAAIPHLDTKNLLQEAIGLPPLEEQKAIVEVVETLFKEVEQLEQLTLERISLKEDIVTSALNQLKTDNAKKEWAFLQEHFHSFFNETTNIKKLRETVLQLAVQGKLTADWRDNNPNVEDASVLLKRIQNERAQLVKEKKVKDEKQISLITEEEIPYSLPESWVWCRMQDLCPNISSGSTPPKPYFKEEGVPYLKVYNIKNQKIDFYYRKQYVDQKYHSTKLKRSILKPGDVIMNIVGPPLGKVAIIPNDFPEWNCNQAISFFQPLDRKLNTWIYTYLLAGTFLDRIELIGTAGQDNISVTKSKTIMLPLPPFEEQKAIVQKVNALMDLCDALEQEVQLSQEHSEQLMQSCLREVFKPDNLN